MLISYAVTSPDYAQTVTARIESMLAEQAHDHLLAGVDLEQLNVSAPHEVHVAHLSHIANGTLENTQRTGLRYLLVQGDRPVADLEFTDTADFIGMHVGPFVAATVQGILTASSSTDYPDSFELKYLKIPALYLICLLFDSGQARLYMPLDPAPLGLNAYAIYEEGALLGSLVGPATSAEIQPEPQP